eukprot:TRINITY_DN5116_c0_g1_i2.p1 TRINITY_DN5116_c0_g1~~TRINITY_DN5116_c0_g1_i2.p1  ORF type:complete len:1830 (+),score=458.32 TRINITY_DN5116_c0_g1_i2:42-5531(+)
MSLDDGEAVYYKSPDDSWIFGHKKGNTVISENKDKEWKIKSNSDSNDLYVIMDPNGVDEDTDDLLKMGELHEGALLRCVRKRHANDEIYTFIGGSVVLSLNPWKFTIPSYTPDRIPFYASGGKDPPHIWCIGKTAYENMLMTKTNQTVLVSGESGAGKTEAVKSLLKFLGALSSIRAGSAENEEGQKGLLLQQQIEACNPILETFGNAKTVRNDNSSRFGKFLKVIYNENGVVCGAHTINYLLERSRVVKAAPNERLFHSFYQLLSTKKARSKYKLDEGKAYEVCGDSIIIEGVDDAEGFEETNAALSIIGIPEEQQDSVWGMVAGILHLQRVTFAKNETTDATEVTSSSKKYLKLAADCWGVDVEPLEQEFLTVKVKAGNETVTRKHSVLKAQSCRDAICKETYASLFQWLIDRINETMKPTSEEASFIGLLDIFGFEHFKLNSLEQLCINLANEMLQNHYNEHIFTADIAECKAEGIETQHVEYQDNTEIVSCIADTKHGILAHLDDQCKTRPEDDAAFLERVTTQYESKENIFRRTKLDRDCFRISHYAAEVAYAVEGFGEKNLDSVQGGLLDLLQSSSKELVAEVLKSDHRSQDTVTSIFKKQLKSLLTVIESTTPAWIRCIKPHPVKKPGLFDPNTTMAQLASSGVLETVRVRKLGYPVRLPHALFAERFKILLPAKFNADADPEARSQAILNNLNLSKEKAQIGKTKVFLRSFAHTYVEDARIEAFDTFANTIRSFALTALAMQDAFGKKHRELVALLKQQRTEREEFIASHEESVAELPQEELTCRQEIYAMESEGQLICLSSQFDRIYADLCEKELRTRGAIIQLCEDEEKYRVDMEYDKSLPTLFIDEQQEFDLITEVQWSEQTDFLCELVATQHTLVEQFHQSEVIALESEEDFERCILTIEQSEESLREQLKFEERFRTEEAIQEASASHLEVHASERMFIEHEEVDLRDEISIEEEGYWEILKVTHAQSWERAKTVQNWREINDLIVMEETLRTALLRDYDLDVDLLWVDHSHLKVGLFSQYMFDCEIQEASQRNAILRPYWSFWSALQHAWDSTLYVALLLELQSNHLRSRDSLIGLYDESIVVLETLEAREGSNAATLARDRELERVYENLKKMEKQLAHQLPPPAFAAVEHGYGRELQPYSQQTIPHSPQRQEYERSMSPAKRQQRRTTSTSVPRSVSQSHSLTPQTCVPDPFSQGTWLWRTITPTVQKGWKRLWVKLAEGQLIFRSSPSSESRILKLSNVTFVDTHELPDRDGYKPPNEKMPSVAKRYSSSCKYSAIKLGLKADVEGSVVPRKKSMILCAEFPAVAVIWLKKLKREWLKVCDEEYKQPTFESLSPMREQDHEQPPRGLIDISKLLEAAEVDSQAANLLRDLRKWMKKTKQCGYNIPADINFRASSMPPQSPERERSPEREGSPSIRRGGPAQSPHFKEPDEEDNFSDLSDNVDCPKCAAGEGVTFAGPTEIYESGKSAVDEWIDEYRKQPQPFTRDHFAECLRTGGPIRTLCAPVSSFGTDSCNRVMDNLIKRILLGYGDHNVSQKEFIVWCSAGSEEPAPLYYHKVGLQAVDSIFSAAVIIAAASTPYPSLQLTDSSQTDVISGDVGVRTPLSIVRESEAGSPLPPKEASPSVGSPPQQLSPPVAQQSPPPQHSPPSQPPHVVPQQQPPPPQQSQQPPPVIPQQQQQQQQQQHSPPPQQQSPPSVQQHTPPPVGPQQSPKPVVSSELKSQAEVPITSSGDSQPVQGLKANPPPVVESEKPLTPKQESVKPPEVKVETEVEAPEPGTAWKCPFCETENDADAAVCEICETQSPHKATSQAFPQ